MDGDALPAESSFLHPRGRSNAIAPASSNTFRTRLMFMVFMAVSPTGPLRRCITARRRHAIIDADLPATIAPVRQRAEVPRTRRLAVVLVRRLPVSRRAQAPAVLLLEEGPEVLARRLFIDCR